MIKYKGYRIVIKPNFFKVLGSLYCSAQAIYPFILIPSKVIDEKKDDILIHEITHLERMKSYGVIRWYLKYLTSSKFRYTEELEAVKRQIDYLKNSDIPVDYPKFAKSLSCWVYLKMVKFDKAYNDIINF